MQMTDSMRRCIHRPTTLRQPTPVTEKPIPVLASPKPYHDSGGVHFTIPGAPIGKPRQTRADKWKKRPCVMRYREWADRARAAAPELPKEPLEISFIAYLPFPPSYSTKKRDTLRGQFHRGKPDADNILKCADALFERDCGIAMAYVEKRWDDGKGARLEVFVK